MAPWLILAQAAPNGGGAGEAALAGGVMLFSLLLGALSLVLLIWALVDAIKNPRLSDTERIVWVLVIIFVGCLGPILYLLIGRNTSPRGPTGTPPGGSGL